MDIEGLDTLRSLTAGERAIRVAVLDGPVDLQHRCFAGASIDVVPTLVANVPGDDAASRHGTQIASVIFGRPFGIAPGCHGLIVPVFAPGSKGTWKCSQLDLARAIDLALAHGAHIINISGGEMASGDVADDLLAQSLQRCADAGVLIIAAAGNDGCACVHLPAAHPTVLAVGAMDAAGRPLHFSNWGEAYSQQGILVPGDDILGGKPFGGEERRTGTSFAAAVMSGIAALLLSLQKRPDPLGVRAAILGTAKPCESGDEHCLAGRLDLPALLRTIAGDVIPCRPATRGISISTINEEEKKEEDMDQESPVETAVESVDDQETDVLLDELTGAAIGARDNVEPSGCGCGSSNGSCSCRKKSDCACGKKSQCTCGAPKSLGRGLVYALGTIGYDFRHEARRDSLFQASQRNLSNPAEMLAYLEEAPPVAEAVSWTLQLDSTIAYTIRPVGAYAAETYARLRELLASQLNEGADRVSVPGIIRGAEKLLSGQSVPRIIPELRAMYSWTTPALTRAVLGEQPSDSDAGGPYAEQASAITNFLDRIYYELRNFGITPQDRALNFAATNAFQASSVFHQAIKADLQLDCIDVERSPTCRPGADCWDVKLVFFNPAHRLDQARRIYRFTIDVSDVVPVSIGRLRSWDLY